MGPLVQHSQTKNNQAQRDQKSQEQLLEKKLTK
jgi:hypothetical protein